MEFLPVIPYTVYVTPILMKDKKNVVIT